MEDYLQATMDGLGIVEGDYSVLHIRTHDDKTFPQVPLSQDFLMSLYDAVKLNIDPGKRYLLITAHKGVKDFFIRYSNIFMRLGTKSCHLGQEVAPTDDAVRDTLLDFFLISRARDVVGITPYGISGFSGECAKVFNVPFKQVKM
jgi:hypothetical protein